MNVKCRICPHNCVIRDGRFGICGVRGASGGELVLPFFGAVSAASSDPIEKKPLYHFHPSKSIFSIGFYGCNLTCPFCQNHRISKDFSPASPGATYSSAQIVDAAVESASFGIAYTYSEPIVHFEFVTETAALAREKGLKNVLVTNGFIMKNTGIELLENIDAVNIDLKSFSNDFYKKELGGRLDPVLDFIRISADRVHTEVTTLLIPGKNDGDAEIDAASKFLAGINPDIPYHLSAYYPAFKYRTAATSPEALIMSAKIASANLNFVYTGNIDGGLTDTHCPSCGRKLISRSGYRTLMTGIRAGACKGCGTDVGDFGIVL